jgi:hypothetical protein
VHHFEFIGHGCTEKTIIENFIPCLPQAGVNPWLLSFGDQSNYFQIRPDSYRELSDETLPKQVQ